MDQFQQTDPFAHLRSQPPIQRPRDSGITSSIANPTLNRTMAEISRLNNMQTPHSSLIDRAIQRDQLDRIAEEAAINHTPPRANTRQIISAAGAIPHHNPPVVHYDHSQHNRQDSRDYPPGNNNFNPQRSTHVNPLGFPLHSTHRSTENNHHMGHIAENAQPLASQNRRLSNLLQFQSNPSNYDLLTGNVPLEDRTRHLGFPMRRKILPMVSWGLKFRGDGDGLSLNDFMSQVEMKALGQGLTYEDMLYDFIDLLDGPAKTWYRSSYRNFMSWEDLKRGMRLQFLPRDYDYLLRRQIEDRLQAPTENFGIYKANMDMLFNALQVPLTEQHKIDILIRNMDEFYISNLDNYSFASVDDLTQYCRHQEYKKSLLSRRHSNSQIYVEPAFQTPQKPFVRRGNVQIAEIEEPVEENYALNIAGRPRVTERGPKCWNCAEAGHSFRTCNKPKQKIFCYRCGRSNVSIKDCPFCRGNEPAESEK